MKRENWNSLKHINLGLSFGLSLVASLLFGYFGGTWLDTKLNTEPIFMILGLLLAIYMIYRSFRELMRVLEESNRLEAKLQRQSVDKEELHRQKVLEAQNSLNHAKSILTDFEEMVAEKERQALRRIRGEQDEDPNVDSRGDIKKY